MGWWRSAARHRDHVSRARLSAADEAGARPNAAATAVVVDAIDAVGAILIRGNAFVLVLVRPRRPRSRQRARRRLAPTSLAATSRRCPAPRVARAAAGALPQASAAASTSSERTPSSCAAGHGRPPSATTIALTLHPRARLVTAVPLDGACALHHKGQDFLQLRQRRHGHRRRLWRWGGGVGRARRTAPGGMGRRRRRHRRRRRRRPTAPVWGARRRAARAWPSRRDTTRGALAGVAASAIDADLVTTTSASGALDASLPERWARRDCT